MRAMIAGAASGGLAVILARFVDNFFMEIMAAIILGGLVGLIVALMIQPRVKVEDKP